MALLIFMVMGIVLILKDVYRLFTGTDYRSMQKKVDDLLQTILEQEVEIRQLRAALQNRNR